MNVNVRYRPSRTSPSLENHLEVLTVVGRVCGCEELGTSLAADDPLADLDVDICDTVSTRTSRHLEVTTMLCRPRLSYFDLGQRPEPLPPPPVVKTPVPSRYCKRER